MLRKTLLAKFALMWLLIFTNLLLNIDMNVRIVPAQNNYDHEDDSSRAFKEFKKPTCKLNRTMVFQLRITTITK